jgi:phosphatidate cytidylyltransferase
MAVPGASIEAVLLAATLVIGAATVARGRPAAGALASAAGAVFAIVYLGLGIGSVAAVRAYDGRGPLLLLMLTVMISDTAQYYTGRAIGRRRLAPAISPKKTVEGALGGIVAGSIVAALAGPVWLPAVGPAALALLGATLATLGIVGDLFESLLKRSAGVKDTSALIPGHGGVLDRIDSWLFAGPVYYVFLRYV